MAYARVLSLMLYSGSLLMAGCEAPAQMPPSTSIPAVHREAFMPTGQAVSPPQGFTSFCHRDPQECIGGTDQPRHIKLTRERGQELEAINAYVNGFPENTDEANYHQTEFWTFADPVRGGDCEDLALAKRKLLIDHGWPAEDLLLAMVDTATGESHVVLIAVTEQGEYVLDNKNWAIIPWGYAPFTWEKRQSRERPSVWVELNPHRFTGEALKLPPLGQSVPVIASTAKPAATPKIAVSTPADTVRPITDMPTSGLGTSISQ